MTVIVRSDDTTKSRGSVASIREVIANAKEGLGLTQADAYSLVTANSDVVQEMCIMTASMRDRVKGNVVTFSPKVFIPLTHMCRDFCGYCTFRKNPQQAGKDLFMTPEQVLEVATHTFGLRSHWDPGLRSSCRTNLFVAGS